MKVKKRIFFKANIFSKIEIFIELTSYTIHNNISNKNSNYKRTYV